MLDEPEVRVHADWGDAIFETPIQFCDQLIGSFRGDYILLSLGQVAQPQFLPRDVAAMAALKQKGTLPIRTQFRAAIPVSEFGSFLAAMVGVARTHGFLPEQNEESSGGS